VPSQLDTTVDQSNHLRFIERCFELAAEAVEEGNHPFGALLVLDGHVIAESRNEVVTSNDATRHAELLVLHAGLPGIAPADRGRVVLYTSTEPCAMCSGAAYWSRIGHIVFGCSAHALADAAGADFLIPSRELLARGEAPPHVTGPLLEERGRSQHLAYWGVDRG
jgi:tRNA(Arg) A34 adenosine deaminase TadA